MKRILLAGPEVRQVLETGRVVVRRAVKPQPHMYEPGQDDGLSDYICDNLKCPLGKPGEYVWVGETWAEATDFGYATDYIFFRATYICGGPYDDVEQWKSSSTLPEALSRLTLEIVSVKIEHHDKWEWVYELKRVQQ